jgi:hypothetical protein
LNRRIKNPKHQIPNPKEIPSPKNYRVGSQACEGGWPWEQEFERWLQTAAIQLVLEIGFWSFLGVWNLELAAARLVSVAGIRKILN